MGRPAWANEAQWTWLTDQAADYMKIKGDKKQTAKFWPTYLDGWKERWPTPALTDLVRDTDNTASTNASTEADSGEVSAVPVTATVEDTDNTASTNASTEDDSGEVPTVAAAATVKKKVKKPLTVGTVCIFMMLGVS
jgi:hypothetical protein